MKENKKKVSKVTDKELEKTVGGGYWSTEICGNCYNICYNPKYEHFGHYVSISAGPPASKYGVYIVCDFCDELITNEMGTPIIICG